MVLASHGAERLYTGTPMAKSGTAFTQADSIAYLYNDRSEVTSAIAQNETLYNYAYNFDNIGNRTTATERSVASAYTSNNLNQYTLINTAVPTYDNDGNMTSAPLSSGTWTLTWDADNRLISSTSGTKTLNYKSDFMSRRIEKTVIDSGTATKSLRFVYDGYKMIEELDALNGNAIRKKIVWSGDTPVSIYDTALNATYYYVLDANKNVSELIDASGNIVAHYEYSPFGKITVQTGSYAEENPIRFSSEYFDTETSLVYYNYRYYSPDLGRWLSKDPIEERGGLNLYGMVGNGIITYSDMLGYEKAPIPVKVDPSQFKYIDRTGDPINTPPPIDKTTTQPDNTPTSPSSTLDNVKGLAKEVVKDQVRNIPQKLYENYIDELGEAIMKIAKAAGVCRALQIKDNLGDFGGGRMFRYNTYTANTKNPSEKLPHTVFIIKDNNKCWYTVHHTEQQRVWWNNLWLTKTDIIVDDITIGNCASTIRMANCDCKHPMYMGTYEQ